MKLTTIENSSIIKRLAYCEKCRTLRIKFVKGGVYEYYNVSKTEYDNLINEYEHGESIGKYYHEDIKNYYDFNILVPSTDKEGTQRFRMADNHNCSYSGNISKPESQIAKEMFQGKPEIETLYRIKGGTTLFTNKKDVNKAIEEDEDINRRLNLLDELVLKSFNERDIEYVTNFILENIVEITNILSN